MEPTDHRTPKYCWSVDEKEGSANKVQFASQSMNRNTKTTDVEESPELLALSNAVRSEQKRVEVLMKIGHRFDMTYYRGLIATLASFLEVWEPRLAQALPPEWQDWFVCRRKSVLLKHDLSMLNISIAKESLSPTFDLDTPVAAWGSLYAMEVLTLDSQKIAIWLQKGHSIGSRNGGAFFSVCGDRTDALWRELIKVLHEMVKGPRSQAEACTGAIQTLRALAKMLRNASTKKM